MKIFNILKNINTKLKKAHFVSGGSNNYDEIPVELKNDFKLMVDFFNTNTEEMIKIEDKKMLLRFLSLKLFEKYDTENGINEKLKYDKDIILFRLKNLKVKKNDTLEFYKKLPENLKNDFDVLKELIKNNSKLYEVLPTDFKMNKDIATSYIKNEVSRMNLQNNIPIQYLNSKEFAELVVELDPLYFSLVNEKYKDDDYFGLKLVKKNPLYIKNLSERLQKDEKIRKIALRENPLSCAYMDDIRNDDKKMKSIFNNNYYVFKYASETFRSNLEYAKEAIKRDPDLIEYVGEELKDNFELFNSAVCRNDSLIKFATEDGFVRNNLSIMLVALIKDMSNIKYVGTNLINDVPFMETIFKNLKDENEYDRKKIIAFISEKNKNIFKEEKIFKYIKESKLIGYVFSYLSEDMRNTEEHALEAASYIDTINYLGEDLQRNNDFLVKLCQKNNEMIEFLHRVKISDENDLIKKLLISDIPSVSNKIKKARVFNEFDVSKMEREIQLTKITKIVEKRESTEDVFEKPKI